jgi:polysaccharide export outer membrane protein
MRKSLIILLLLPLLLAGCQSYKKVPYLQDALQEVAAGNTGTADMPLYDARIMPKDLLTIVVSCPEEPELAEPFNLTVSTPISNIGDKITTQPVLQQYLVDNDGNVEFPVLGTIHLGGLTKREAEQYIKDQLKSQFRETPIVTVRMINYKISVIGEVGRPGTFTIYGIRDNVKLIREDNTGKREIVTLNLNDQDILQSPYYYLQQNDILYVTPNKTKAKTSNISSSTTIWFSVIGSLVSLASLIIAITK